MDPLKRWNQLNELDDQRHSMRRLFSRSRWPKPRVGVPQWIPLVDASEEAACYVLRAELPQVEQKDLKITLARGTLTITGNRKFDPNSRKDHRVEHAYGRLAHSFVLPADARPAKVRSVFKDGVLTVHLAKNGRRLAVPPLHTSRFPETQTAKKNENENETAIMPRQ